MPQVTFLGPFAIRRSPCGRGEDFYRKIPKEVSQAWLDQWRHRLPERCWTVAGDAGAPVDLGDDGIPDSGWRRKDIIKWLAEYDAKPSGYATKTQLLDIVDALMNPDRVEEVEDIVEEPEPEPETVEVEENVEEAPLVEENEGE